MSNLPNKSDVMIDEGEYPIAIYEPNSDLDLRTNKPIHVFSAFEEAVNFIQSQETSFLLIIPKDFNEDAALLKSLKERNFYGRRLTDIEDESILQQVLNEATIVEKSSYKVYLLFTCEDFESEVFVEEGAIKWEAREVAKKFRKEVLFWERKQRGLEKADTVFEYLGQPEGFADFWKEEDYVKCQEFCIRKLRELVNKRNHEKEKLVYYDNLGDVVKG